MVCRQPHCWLLTPVGARRKRSASARISVVALHRKYSRISNSGKRVSLTKSNLTRGSNKVLDKHEYREDYLDRLLLTWIRYIFYCSPMDITKEEQ